MKYNNIIYNEKTINLSIRHVKNALFETLKNLENKQTQNLDKEESAKILFTLFDLEKMISDIEYFKSKIFEQLKNNSK